MNVELKKNQKNISSEMGLKTEGESLLKDFMTEHGVQKSKKGQNIIELLGGVPKIPCPRYLLDHAELYERNGKPYMLVGHPYKSAIRDIEKDVTELFIWCDKHNLSVEINPCESWYNPGRCHVIVLKGRGLT